MALYVVAVPFSCALGRWKCKYFNTLQQRIYTLNSARPTRIILFIILNFFGVTEGLKRTTRPEHSSYRQCLLSKCEASRRCVLILRSRPDDLTRKNETAAKCGEINSFAVRHAPRKSSSTHRDEQKMYLAQKQSARRWIFPPLLYLEKVYRSGTPRKWVRMSRCTARLAGSSQKIENIDVGPKQSTDESLIHHDISFARSILRHSNSHHTGLHLR